MSGTLLRALIALYPRAWRQRYEDEFTDMVTALYGDDPTRRGRLRLAADILAGALDAHRHAVRGRFAADPALRRGVVDGLLISVVTTTVLVLSNVVFPAGPAESDGDPEYLAQIFAGYVLLALLLVAIGVRARRRSDHPWAGARGGAAAGCVMAIAVLIASLVIDNAFLSIVSQQHDKRVAFEASGWTSMRAYLNVRTAMGAFVVIPSALLIGGLLGAIGGAIGGAVRAKAGGAH